jgi:hypothetical protein
MPSCSSNWASITTSNVIESAIGRYSWPKGTADVTEEVAGFLRCRRNTYAGSRLTPRHLRRPPLLVATVAGTVVPRNGWLLLGLRCSSVLAATPPRTRGPFFHAALASLACPTPGLEVLQEAPHVLGVIAAD